MSAYDRAGRSNPGCNPGSRERRKKHKFVIICLCLSSSWDLCHRQRNHVKFLTSVFFQGAGWNFSMHSNCSRHCFFLPVGPWVQQTITVPIALSAPCLKLSISLEIQRGEISSCHVVTLQVYMQVIHFLAFRDVISMAMREPVP